MTRFRPECGAPPILKLHFDSDPGSVEGTIFLVTSSLWPRAPVGAEIGTIEIVLAEVINNIAEHAYGGACDGMIGLSIWKSDAGIWVEFSDRGAPMPNGLVPAGNPQDLSGERADLPEGGFGWHLIRSLTTDLTYERHQNQNRLCFHIALG